MDSVCAESADWLSSKEESFRLTPAPAESSAVVVVVLSVVPAGFGVPSPANAAAGLDFLGMRLCVTTVGFGVAVAVDSMPKIPPRPPPDDDDNDDDDDDKTDDVAEAEIGACCFVVVVVDADDVNEDDDALVVCCIGFFEVPLVAAIFFVVAVGDVCGDVVGEEAVAEVAGGGEAVVAVAAALATLFQCFIHELNCDLRPASAAMTLSVALSSCCTVFPILETRKASIVTCNLERVSAMACMIAVSWCMEASWSHSFRKTSPFLDSTHCLSTVGVCPRRTSSASLRSCAVRALRMRFTRTSASVSVLTSCCWPLPLRLLLPMSLLPLPFRLLSSPVDLITNVGSLLLMLMLLLPVLLPVLDNGEMGLFLVSVGG